MLKFCDELYVSDKLKNDQKHLIAKLRHGDADTHFYVIYRNDENGHYEYMHSVFFRNQYLMLLPLTVFGICDNASDALNYLAYVYSKDKGYEYDIVQDESDE